MAKVNERGVGSFLGGFGCVPLLRASFFYLSHACGPQSTESLY
jgi:hypothetical protein